MGEGYGRTRRGAARRREGDSGDVGAAAVSVGTLLAGATVVRTSSIVANAELLTRVSVRNNVNYATSSGNPFLSRSFAVNRHRLLAREIRRGKGHARRNRRRRRLADMRSRTRAYAYARRLCHLNPNASFFGLFL